MRNYVGWIALAVSAGAVAVMVFGLSDAEARDSRGRPRWEYGALRVSGEKIIFSQGMQETTLTPPTDSLPHRSTNPGPNTARYIQTIGAKRNHAMAALDVFDTLGWEAISFESTGGEMIVLMKRMR